MLAPLLFSMACAADDGVNAQIDAGNFKAARASIDQALATGDITSEGRRALEFEAERMRRIELDFSLSEQQARDKVREKIPDLKPEDFAAWDKAGLLEHRVIDGSKRYFNRAPSNLFRLSAEARARRAQQTP